MGIDLRDLSPAYQVKAMQQLAEQNRQRAAAKGERERKYHNQKDQRPTTSGGAVRFDSRKEARRYDELIALLHAGQIRELRLQPQFTLQEAYTTPEGVRVRAIRYQADFSYLLPELRPYRTETGVEVCDWILVVEDVKSRATKTRVYEMKKKLMRERFQIEIQEV
ncbi:DUF1064 domain-containing protein [uncultured Dysosmobacter sp.]|uniref:DUF1064 domain-containing protein n=1 Tax=uncultured Dysosmobacter sp. TaxID=2591384 RepID=UPI002604417F|nr:DUF1064 domain-containing protein [uncultured Dysosmobacter sp.]